MTSPGLLAAARRALARNPSATTVTVTRVTGSPSADAEPEKLVITTEEPAQQPPASHRLARAAMAVAAVALAVALSGIAYRAWKD
jgi:hypothetical protein